MAGTSSPPSESGKDDEKKDATNEPSTDDNAATGGEESSAAAGGMSAEDMRVAQAGAMVDSAMVRDERVRKEKEKASKMSIGDLKMKLQAMGILTATFNEKSELVDALAEAEVKKKYGTSIVGDDFVDGAEEDDDDDDSGFQDMPEYIDNRVEKLADLHDQRDSIMKDYLKERAQLEAKYQELCKPLYDRRAKIIQGKLDEEIDISDPIDENNLEQNEKVKGVPNFWLTAMSAMPVIAQLITDQDIDCLSSLEDIRCKDDDDGRGFTLSFQFAENDYFVNTLPLTKRYNIPNLLLADEPIIQSIEGCEIHWKQDNSLTERSVTKKQRGTGKHAGKVRNVKKKVNLDSFFHFFATPKMPNMDEMTEEDAEEMEATFNDDYDVAQAFRSHIVPKAVLWYAGQGMEDGMDEAIEGAQWPPGAGPTDCGGESNPECQQS